MSPRTHTPRDLDIESASIFFKLYTMWQEVDADLESAGLGMPSTFADHISRINSSSQVVRDTEKAWFEALVKSTHELTEHQFETVDPNPEPNGSEYIASATGPRNKDFPTYFTNVDKPTIPRLRPSRVIAMPHFDVPNGHAPHLEFGYTKEQLAHRIRVIASVSPYDTFHRSSSSGEACIKKLHIHRPGWTIAQICPDLVPGIICGYCDAEGFVLANYIMARSGMNGQAHKNTVPSALLKNMAKHSLQGSIKTPFEQFIWSFAADSYANDQDINGCEHRAWNVLQKERSFKQMRSWVPTTPTKAAFKKEQDRLAKVKPVVKTEVKVEDKGEKRKRDA